jgi:hypothetical protein
MLSVPSFVLVGLQLLLKQTKQFDNAPHLNTENHRASIERRMLDHWIGR